MNIITKITIVSVAILFGGCATTATTLKHAQSKYVGKNMDALAMDIGAPQNKYVMSNGDVMYKWVHTANTLMSATTIYNGSPTSGMATTIGGNMTRVCDMSVLTNQKNIIKRIKFNRDTLGTTPAYPSMCGQMFGIN